MTGRAVAGGTGTGRGLCASVLFWLLCLGCALPLALGQSGQAPAGLVAKWRNPDGASFAFNGSNTVTVADSPDLDLPDGSSWSLEAWVFPTHASVPQHIAGKRGACGGGDGFYQLALDHSPDGQGMGINSRFVPVNTWTHLVLTMNGGVGWTVYANGVEVKMVRSPGWHVRNSGPFRIGGAGNCRPFIGYIDEVSLYRRALSVEEVRRLYLSGQATGLIRTATPPHGTMTSVAQRVQSPSTPPRVAATAPQDRASTPPRLAAAPPSDRASTEHTQTNTVAAPRSNGRPGNNPWVPERRVALVIGNSRYAQGGVAASEQTWPDLENGPVKDADAMAARLRGLHFDVTELTNQNIDQMNAALRAFSERLTSGHDQTLALFYFSGHGARAPRDLGDNSEETFLVPVGTNLQYDVDAHTKAVGLGQISNIMRVAAAGVVILDACRNNALRRPASRAAGTRGLGAPPGSKGMLFAFSTAAGEVAGNRAGQMSEYTELLVHEIGAPGETLTSSFRSVRRQLAEGPHGQSPELLDGLNDDIVLVP